MANFKSFSMRFYWKYSRAKSYLKALGWKNGNFPSFSGKLELTIPRGYSNQISQIELFLSPLSNWLVLIKILLNPDILKFNLGDWLNSTKVHRIAWVKIENKKNNGTIFYVESNLVCKSVTAFGINWQQSGGESGCIIQKYSELTNRHRH